MEVIQYEHHGNTVFVDATLKGRHRDFCLCYSCKLFTPDNRETNCPIASRLYQIDVEEGLVTPVWECPKFQQA